MRNYRASPYDCILTDCNAGKNVDPCAYPCVTFDVDFLRHYNADVVRLMVDCEESDLWPEHNSVLNDYRADRHCGEAMIGEHVFTEHHSAGYINLKRRCKERTFLKIPAEQLALKGDDAVFVVGVSLVDLPAEMTATLHFPVSLAEIFRVSNVVGYTVTEVIEYAHG